MMKHTQVVNVRTTALYVHYSGHNPSLSRGFALAAAHLPLPAREVTVRALSVWPRSGASRTAAGGGPARLVVVPHSGWAFLIRGSHVAVRA